ARRVDGEKVRIPLARITSATAATATRCQAGRISGRSAERPRSGITTRLFSGAATTRRDTAGTTSGDAGNATSLPRPARAACRPSLDILVQRSAIDDSTHTHLRTRDLGYRHLAPKPIQRAREPRLHRPAAASHRLRHLLLRPLEPVPIRDAQHG